MEGLSLKELELFKNIISTVESAKYKKDNMDFLRDRAYMILKNTLGEDNSYNERLYNIRFKPRRLGYDESQCEQIWREGKQDLINLLRIALEEYESFVIQSKDDSSSNRTIDDLFYNVTKHLAEQTNPLDKSIALFLNYADFDIEESTSYSNRYNCVWASAIIKLPPQLIVKFTDEAKQRLIKVLNAFTPSQWGIDFSYVSIEAKLEKAYDEWRNDILKELIGQGINNQANFASSNHPMFEYKGIKFRSKSELKLAPEFEASNVLFFPLPLAVCGNDHKEPDFLVCKNGKFAILEVITDYFHPSVEKEAERTTWFQNHHISIRSYPATQCYNTPKEVVTDFLKWMDGLIK